MIKFRFLLITLLFVSSLSAQLSDAEKVLAYPPSYQFEQAERFIQDGQIEKALWYFINLYPENQDQVVEAIKKLGSQQDSINLETAILNAFAKYAPFDPEISTDHGGTPVTNTIKLKQKTNASDALIATFRKKEAKPVTASEYNARGLNYFDKGFYEQAIKDFNRAIELEKKAEYYFNRAYSLASVEDYAGAIRDYDVCVVQKYRPAETHFHRGFCKDASQDQKGAFNDYNKAIKLDPNYADAYNNRATLYYFLKKYKKALHDFNKTIELDDQISGAYVNRAFVKLELKDSIGACTDFQTALNLGYSDAQALIELYCNNAKSSKP